MWLLFKNLNKFTGYRRLLAKVLFAGSVFLRLTSNVQNDGCGGRQFNARARGRSFGSQLLLLFTLLAASSFAQAEQINCSDAPFFGVLMVTLILFHRPISRSTQTAG